METQMAGRMEMASGKGPLGKGIKVTKAHSKLERWVKIAYARGGAEIAIRRAMFLPMAALFWVGMWAPIVGSIYLATKTAEYGYLVAAPAAFFALAAVLFFGGVFRVIAPKQPDTLPPGPAKRVCVVGAGPSGLATTKELLAAGHVVDCFDKQPVVGGMWMPYQPEQACVPDYTQMVSSPVVTCFSDFPPQPLLHRQWTCSEYLEYLQQYAAHFKLERNLKLDHFVHSIKPIEVEGKPLQWEVTVEHDGVTTTHVYDHVALANGLHKQGDIPKYPGMENFKGQILPFSQVKGLDVCKDRRVAVIGFGEAASDLAGKAAGVAKEAYICIARGKLLVPRILPTNGLPADYATNRMRYAPPLKIRSWFHSARWWLLRFCNQIPAAEVVRHYFLDFSRVGVYNMAATKSSDIIQPILQGNLTVVPEAASFTENGITFKDGSHADVDIVIFCTGFKVSLPNLTLPRGAKIEPSMPGPTLYNHTFHPDLGHSIAFIAYARPAFGAIPPIGELQARWFSNLVSGRSELPSPDAMRKSIKEQVHWLKHEFPAKPFPHPVVHYVPIMDKLSDEVGCRPYLWQMLLQPVLLWRVMTGPYVPAQFRLRGRNAVPEQAAKLIRNIPRGHGLDELAAYCMINYYCYCLYMLGFRRGKYCSTFL